MQFKNKGKDLGVQFYKSVNFLPLLFLSHSFCSQMLLSLPWHRCFLEQFNSLNQQETLQLLVFVFPAGWVDSARRGAQRAGAAWAVGVHQQDWGCGMVSVAVSGWRSSRLPWPGRWADGCAGQGGGSPGDYVLITPSNTLSWQGVDVMQASLAR